MTKQEKQQLSRDVAVKYKIEASRRYIVNSEDITTWLHEDSARCFDLMAEHEIDLSFVEDFVFSYTNNIQGYFLNRSGVVRQSIRYTDHNNDKQEATRIAILKALLAKGE